MSVAGHFDDVLLLLPDEVHQASGMVSVQMGVSVNDALTHVCRYAGEHRQDVVAVADQVITRKLRFSPIIPLPRVRDRGGRWPDH